MRPGCGATGEGVSGTIALMPGNRLIFSVHAVKRMFERRIRHEDVREIVRNGRTIEEYPDDTPYPSRLIMGWVGDRCTLLWPKIERGTRP